MPEEMTLDSGAEPPLEFAVVVSGAPHGGGRWIRITGPAAGSTERIAREYRLPRPDQDAYLDFFSDVARDFGTRAPSSHRPGQPPADYGAVLPILTEPLADGILYGYGDPSVTRIEGDGWRLLVTSNDAADAFPILASPDLKAWRHVGFVFPRDRLPAWTLAGPNVGDFWAPELHRVGGEYWVCFAAREHDRSLSIGLAKSTGPDGPFLASPEPIVRGGVIDPHLAVDENGEFWLLWKRDHNDVWPRLLCERLHGRGDAQRLFPDEGDRRTAIFIQTLWPWIRTLEPMEQFFLLQPLIEAVTAEFSEFGRRLREEPGGGVETQAILSALRTRIYAQRVSADGSILLGEPSVVLENDQPWEAHLIEGVWVTRHGGRWYMFYAGNDFSTPHYGIGVAVSENLLGPYQKRPEPLLRTTRSWSGPGHPSIAIGPDGRHHMFLHAFPPGTAAYKAFRALLTVPITFDGDEVRLG